LSLAVLPPPSAARCTCTSGTRFDLKSRQGTTARGVRAETVVSNEFSAAPVPNGTHLKVNPACFLDARFVCFSIKTETRWLQVSTNESNKLSGQRNAGETPESNFRGGGRETGCLVCFLPNLSNGYVAGDLRFKSAELHFRALKYIKLRTNFALGSAVSVGCSLSSCSVLLRNRVAQSCSIVLSLNIQAAKHMLMANSNIVHTVLVRTPKPSETAYRQNDQVNQRGQEQTRQSNVMDLRTFRSRWLEKSLRHQ